MISEIIITIISLVFKIIGLAFLAIISFLSMVYSYGKEAWRANKVWYMEKTNDKDETL